VTRGGLDVRYVHIERRLLCMHHQGGLDRVDENSAVTSPTFGRVGSRIGN
jgi:hypothetical protein